MSATGRLVVISGPSGAGKTSVCRALKALPGVEFSVSATTRKPRDGERDGVDYHFLAQDDFAQRVQRGEFLEHARYNQNRYGTLRAPMERALAAGRTFLLEIEVQGTRQLRDAKVPGIFVFIVPPSLQVLEQRLRGRRSNVEDEIRERMQIAQAELAAAHLYDHVIVNDDLQQTIDRVRALIGR